MLTLVPLRLLEVVIIHWWLIQTVWSWFHCKWRIRPIWYRIHCTMAHIAIMMLDSLQNGTYSQYETMWAISAHIHLWHPICWEVQFLSVIRMSFFHVRTFVVCSFVSDTRLSSFPAFVSIIYPLAVISVLCLWWGDSDLQLIPLSSLIYPSAGCGTVGWNFRSTLITAVATPL